MKYFSILVILIILVGCNKPSVLPDLEFHRFLLAGSGNYNNTEHTWSLDSLVVYGKPFALNALQKSYKKTFNYDGTYFDSDGFTGKWSMISVNELQVILNNSSAVNNKQTYNVIDINSIRLSYSITSANGKFDYYYKIVYE
jgi:hypothetical protein